MNGTARVGVLTLGCAVLLMIPLLATPVLPLIDFYNHIARYYVLSHLDEARLAANYASAWALLPNLGLDALATPLLGVMPPLAAARLIARSEEHTSELQSLMRISYAVFCLTK